MEALIPAIFGFLGALIGAASAIAALYLGHRLSEESELAKYKRAKGEAVIADLAELTMWAGDVIKRSLSGEVNTHMPRQVFSVEASIALYFPSHSHHTFPLAKQAGEFAAAAAQIAVEITRGKTVNEKADEIRIKAEPFIHAVESLKREIIADLRAAPEKSQ